MPKIRCMGKRSNKSIGYDLAATADFLGRLKDQVGGTFESAACGQIFGCSKQHAGVPVVTAGMHYAGIGGSVGHSGFFRNRQRVDIRAQADCLAAVPIAAMDDGEYTGAGEGMNLVDRERLQAFLNKSTGAGLGKS